MMLSTPSYPILPTVPLDTSTSFSPYPLTTRLRTHQDILHPSTAGATPSTSGGISGAIISSTSFQVGAPGPGPSTIAASRAAHSRVVDRALLGKRPWGVGMGKESEELEDEEAAMNNENEDIGLFGHRFLLPFGRRQTQMELDAAPSPSPSQVDDDRRQEDRNEGGGPLSPPPMQPANANNAMDEEEDEEGGLVDLDASVEDLDASDGEGEGDDGMEED